MTYGPLPQPPPGAQGTATDSGRLGGTLPFPLKAFTGKVMPLALCRRALRSGDRESWLSWSLGRAAVCLSGLSCAHPRRPLLAGLGARDLDHQRLSAWQSRALERLRRQLLRSWPPPDDSSGQDALEQILHSDDLYTVTAGAALGSYSPDKLRVTKADLHPREVSELTSAAAAKFIAEPHR